MEWIGFVFISALLYSAVELFDKFVVDKEIENYRIASILCGLPIYVFFILLGYFGAEIFIKMEIILLSIFLGFLYTFSLFSYYSGISKEDISRFIPTLSLNTVLITIISFVFLAERLSLPEYAGIGAVVIGAFLISLENPSESLKAFRSGSAVYLGLLVALIGAVSSVLLKYLTATVQLESILFWQGIGGLISVLPLAYFNRSDFKIGKIKGYRNLMTIGIMTSGAYLAFAKAVTLGSVSLTSTLLKINSVMIFFGATMISRIHPEIIQEEIDRAILIQKMLSIALILTGVVLIKLV